MGPRIIGCLRLWVMVTGLHPGLHVSDSEMRTVWDWYEPPTAVHPRWPSGQEDALFPRTWPPGGGTGTNMPAVTCAPSH